MAGEIRTRNAAFLLKEETVEGADAAPTAADAILVEEVTSGVGTSFIESTEVTGSIDAGAPAVIGAPTSWSLRARLRGTVGAPGAGNLPKVDPLLQIMGFERVVQPAVAAAALQAGSATTATLDSSFSNVAEAYRGMPLIITTGVHAGRVALITGYTAGRVATLSDTFDPPLSASFQASIPACVLYRPRSSGIPADTAYHYRDGLLRKLFGSRATGSIQMDAGNIPSISATLTGNFGGESDAPIPAGANAAATLAAPLFVQGALPSPAFTLDKKAVGIATFSIDVGAQLTSPADPNTVNGFGGGLLVSRDMRMNINPQTQLVATRDVIGQLQAGTNFTVAAKAGSVVGNRLGITGPSAQIIEAPDQDDGGIQRRQMQLKLNGADSGVFLVFY